MHTSLQDMLKSPDLNCYDAEEESADSTLLSAYNELRHREKIEGSKKVTQTWRMKERMKTVSVALVLCLNVGVDPPDVVKTSPCARLECWIDPLAQSPQKSLEAIGANLQKQYERWQPRARYKQTLDPTVDEVKKLCTSLRRNAKEERVLYHYNGHGVPKPTVNGEIWVFNKSYTQYIPLSIYDLQTWMGSPSIYVYDCSHAGIIVDLYKQFSSQREQEAASVNGHSSATPPSVKNCIQLAACGADELLPMNSELPADLFTACLTTPIKIALRWYVLQKTNRLVPGLTQEQVDKIPGLLNDRRTMLGELNWIFTAITDTIAWNTLPRDLFQKLFRQDLLVASLFRNFLLAERIMRSYNCTPISGPELPATYHHPMWQAWDLALDLCLRQLPKLLEDDSAEFQHSPFFTEQLTAFDVWLKYGSESRMPPEQLPIVLQVLLSQVHRLRALELLGRFLDLGPWAVSLALSVGIFPYVLKLLQSNARELRPLLVFIWAKILSVDSSCQADLVKDNGHQYFLKVLADQYMPAKQKTMAAFVLAMIVNDYRQGQEAALQGSVIAICLTEEQLSDKSSVFRQWLALCLAKTWTNFDNARWCGVRDSAHEKIYRLLNDPEPEVRASAVYALGTFISNVSEKSDHATSIDLAVGVKLVSMAQDGSPLVRKELVVAFGGLVVRFTTQFAAAAQQMLDDEKQRDRTPAVVTGEVSDGVFHNSSTPSTPMKKSSSSGRLKSFLASSTSSTSSTPAIAPVTPHIGLTSSMDSFPPLETNSPQTRIPRPISSSAISTVMFNNVYTSVWKTILQMVSDPYPEVASMAISLVNLIKIKVTVSSKPRQMMLSGSSTSQSAPSSPSNRVLYNTPVGTPPQLNSVYEESGEHAEINRQGIVSNPTSPYQHSAQFHRHRKMFDKGPSVVEDRDHEKDSNGSSGHMVSTEFFEWSCKQFVKPIMRLADEEDSESPSFLQRQYKFERNSKVRSEAHEEQAKAGFNPLDNEIFVNKIQGIPSVIRFHPYESELAIADKDGITFYDWELGPKLGYFSNGNPRNSKITSLEYINAHDNTLLFCGSDDGCVRLWRNYICDSESDRELVTAFQALSNMLPLTRRSGLVTHWEPDTGMLLASGDVRFIRIWDSQKESKVQDIPTGADSCVTCLASDTSGRSLLIAGCGDGTVRLFDRRLAPTECRVMTLREHSRWIVKVHLQHGSEGKIITSSNSGDVRFWDPRFTESVNCLQLQPGFTSVDIHPRADVFACGSVNQYIGVYNQSGDILNTIKYHDGFIGQRIGSVPSLAFHPFKVKLAAGTNDSYVSVYSSSARRS